MAATPGSQRRQPAACHAVSSPHLAPAHPFRPRTQSRLAPIYDEVAPVLGVFGKLFGKALEAQVGSQHILLHRGFFWQCLGAAASLSAIPPSVHPPPGAHRHGQHSTDCPGHVGAADPGRGPAVAVCLHLQLHPNCRRHHIHDAHRVCGADRVWVDEAGAHHPHGHRRALCGGGRPGGGRLGLEAPACPEQPVSTNMPAEACRGTCCYMYPHLHPATHIRNRRVHRARRRTRSTPPSTAPTSSCTRCWC